MSAAHTRDFEQSVLGSLLIDNEAVDRLGVLKPEHFQDAGHRDVFTTILRLIGDGKAADPITVAEALPAGSHAAGPGAFAYLTDLMAATPSSTNVYHYAEAVRNHAVERSLLTAADEITGKVREAGVSTREKLEYAQGRVMAIAEANVPKKTRHIREIMNDVLDAVQAGIEGTVQRRSSGYPDLDDKADLLEPGALILLGGRPSMGKTTIALNLAEYAAEHHGPVLVLSMEMADVSIGKRTLASQARVPLDHVLRPDKLTDDEMSRMSFAVGKLNDLPLYIDEQGSLSLHEARTKARAVKRRHGLSLLVIDYLQLMSAEGDTRAEAVGDISRGLKGLAKELQIPVIALSQLNRSLENRPNKRPVMSDLRESGSLEQDADVIAFVYRDEVYYPDSPDRGVAELIVAKNRNGAIGMVPLTFRAEFCRFDSFSGQMASREEVKPMRRRFRDGD